MDWPIATFVARFPPEEQNKHCNVVFLENTIYSKIVFFLDVLGFSRDFLVFFLGLGPRDSRGAEPQGFQDGRWVGASKAGSDAGDRGKDF